MYSNLLRIFGKAEVKRMLCLNFCMVKLVMNKERNRKNLNPKAHVLQKEQCIPCVKQLLSRDQVNSPLIDVFHKSTENNTKGRSEKSDILLSMRSDILPHQQCKSTERPIFSGVQPLSAELQLQCGSEATARYSQTSSCTTTLSIPIL